MSKPSTPDATLVVPDDYYCSDDGDTPGNSGFPSQVARITGNKRKRVPEPIRVPEQPPAKKAAVDRRTRHWFLTWNNPPVDGQAILLNLGASDYAFQHETGKSGTPHWQGVFSFKNAVYWSTLCKKCDGAVWAVCRNRFAAKNYCTKLASRSGEVFVKGFQVVLEVKVVDPLDGKTLYPWQKEIVDLLDEEPDNRTILWYWSKSGSLGKSALCKHLCLTMGAYVLGGAFKDGLFAIAKMVEAKKPPSILIWDLPRVKKNHLSVAALEKVKDGCFFSAKYESAQVLFNPPHVLVFANSPPDLGTMSADRWKVTCLDPVDDGENWRDRVIRNAQNSY